VADHDVAIERNGENGEDGDGQKTVAHEREEDAEDIAVNPRPVVEQRSGQWQIETAKHQVRYAQVDDEHGRRIAHLFFLLKNKKNFSLNQQNSN